MKPKRTNTVQIPFANPARVFHTSLPKEEHAVRFLCLSLAVLIVGYVVLVSMSVVNVIASQEAADELTALRTVVSGLENDYFAISKDITAKTGEQLGLTPTENISYVHQNSVVGSAVRSASDL